MRQALERLLDSPGTRYLASAISLALGLFFIFVWSPLPWGWLGIDHYHDQAIRLAAGDSFQTTDVPWGYAYFLAAFYALFGSRPWIPLIAQAALNALVPLLLYRLVRPLSSQRVATLSALVAGVFSFNTVYASTQSTDSVATVLFLTSLVWFHDGRRDGRWLAFAGGGLLAGLVPQFRPNLMLFPPFIATAYLIERPASRKKLTHVAIYLGVACLALAPWVVRNYRLMHVFLPTSTHGGVQLWYGTLQVGPYLESRADNPRTEFGGEAFDYTSVADLPLVVSATRPTCERATTADVTLTYWTNRDPMPRRAPVTGVTPDRATYVLPALPAPTTIYYYFEARWPGSAEPATPTPPGGASHPFVYFVSTDHFGDLDGHNDLLDVFDLIRILRTLAWQEPSSADRSGQDLDADGQVTARDARVATTLLVDAMGHRSKNPFRNVSWDSAAVRLHLEDGSELAVPHAWTGRITDIMLRGEIAGVLVHARRPRQDVTGSPRQKEACAGVDKAVNDVFYRRELHGMRRYTALAMDNISRDPWAYAVSVGYRALRLFVILGSDEKQRSQQFAGSERIYRVGTLVSLTYLVVFLSGAAIAWRRRSGLLLLLLPIVYIPLTICFVLTNMRYTITVQPLMLVFVALGLLRLARLDDQSPTPAR